MSSPKPTKEDFPTLYSTSTAGKTKVWKIDVIPHGTGAKSPAAIRTTHGYEDGKMITNERLLEKGKNLGRSNETTPFEQAHAEAKSKWLGKIDEGYAEKLGKAVRPGVAELGAIEARKTLLPMLAHEYKKRGKDIRFPCYVQPKLDGVRCIFHQGKLTSRNGKPFPHLKHITDELSAATTAGLILDGELYSDTLGFQEVVGLVKKQTLKEEDKKRLLQVHLFVFDCINDEPFDSRWKSIKGFFKDNAGLKHVNIVEIHNCEEKERVPYYLKRFMDEGYEGVMMRNRDGLYRLATRSPDLQKYKLFEDDEFPVINFTEGDGLEKGLVIWICKVPSGATFQVRPRGTHEERAALFKEGKKYIGKKLTVRYQELTDDGIPRFPVGITFREYE